MKLKGKWKGQYSHLVTPDLLKLPKPVDFEIKISFEFFGHFWGSVEEDIENGGMEGKGRIKGLMRKNEIAFVKKMPYFAMIGENGESIQFKDIPHSPIYYSGNWNQETQMINGDWVIRESNVHFDGQYWIIPETQGRFWMKRK